VDVVWETLSCEPPTRDGTPGPVDVLVVGAGILGLATAWACRQRGLSVAVVERTDRIAPGASGRAAGLLVPGLMALEAPGVQAELAARSVALWREWDAELDLGVRRMPWMAVVPFEVETSRESLLSLADARRLEPALGELGGILRLEDQGQVDPLAACRRLAQEVPVHLGVEDLSGLRAGATVWCTGAAPAGRGFETSWVKGHLVATAPVPWRLGHGLSAPDALTVQLADGRIVCGGTLDEGDDVTVDAGAVAGIKARLGALLPATADVPLDHAWACLRPRAGTDAPVIEQVGERDWATWGHFRNGITFAPGTAELLAEWIVTGARPEAAAALGA
jgi:glycine oxidase